MPWHVCVCVGGGGQMTIYRESVLSIMPMVLGIGLRLGRKCLYQLGHFARPGATLLNSEWLIATFS